MEYLPTPYAEGDVEDGAADTPHAVQHIMTLLEFIECQMDARTDFEFVQVSSFIWLAYSNIHKQILFYGFAPIIKFSNKNSERHLLLTQALLRLVLRVHDDAVVQWPELGQICNRLKSNLSMTWDNMDSLMQNVHCMTNYFTSWQGWLE